ncbi:murein L,D-transpeptidase [Rubrivivax gelatinosus]|uniref:Murein L,D-transpeptidase n=1 Tax=Rubrivivax gelatinosus TaxID=28068 RepID=A0ABS1DZU1_RUBGE|nr:L,D-transpeptidase family protein [Rubrivivax gelatinosus]MBK1714152.1 murein L,D-transpeptidase [Rubrivivax gelatinosus]
MARHKADNGTVHPVFDLPALRRLCALAGCLLAAGAQASPWLDGGRPGPLAQQAVTLLASAPELGLVAEDYRATMLGQEVAAAAHGPALDATAAGRLEAALDAALRRLLMDLNQGRIDPRTLYPTMALPARTPFDARAALDAGIAAGSLGAAVRLAEPALPQYAELRQALQGYRAHEHDPAWAAPLPPLPLSGKTRKLEAGAAWSGLAALNQRLMALGDLPAASPVPPVYTEPLLGGVRRFQERHGVTPDGVIGAATFARLEIKPAARAAQLALALERLRWTPLLESRRMIVVNIPEFVLRAYEVQDGRIVISRRMRVVVGQALDKRTPLIDAELRAIEFSPYWNVPPSIVRSETLPKLRRDPGYLAREGFEFVAGDGSVHGSVSAQALDELAAGRWRIRQKPGPRNALGDIKFVFPNAEQIYLHHTPSTGLFARDRRDFSHGCVRLEDPLALALFVLQDTPDWPEARIREAMAAGESKTLRLAEPVRVLIAYGTALVKDGRVFFFDDVYRQDPRLEAALRQRAAAVSRPD